MNPSEATSTIVSYVSTPRRPWLDPLQPPIEETPYVREPGYALRYRDQRFRTGTGGRTHARETAAIESLLATVATPPGGLWLDLPCGAGRLSDLLPGALVVQSDRDPGMTSAAAAPSGRARERVCARAAAIPFADGVFTGALMMRLLHHVASSTERQAILREVRRVTDGPLVVSFFHAVNLQNLRRVVRRKFGRRDTGRSAVTWARFRADLEAAGWTVRGTRPLRRFVSEQWIVLALPSSPRTADA